VLKSININSKLFVYGLYFISSFLLLELVLQGDWNYFLAHDEINPYYKPARAFALNMNNPSLLLELFTHSHHNFGHPPLFPFLAGIVMYLFGISFYVAKVFICFTSAITVFLLFLIGDHLLKDRILNYIFVLSILASSLYTSLFSLFLGDVFLLPFCLLYFLSYLKKQYIIMAITGVFAAYTRESFLFFAFSIFLYEMILVVVTKKKNIAFCISSLIALLSSTSFFIINKFMYGSYIHSFAKIDIENAKITGILNNYISIKKNIIHFLDLLTPHDSKIYFLFLFLLICLGFYKKLDKTSLKLGLLTLLIHLVTFIPLIFFEGIYPRYFIYCFSFLYIFYFLFLKEHISQKKHLYGTALISLIIFAIIPEKEHQLFYSKNANISYYELKKNLKPFMKRLYEGEPIFICFPHNLQICNESNVYGRKMFKDINCVVKVEQYTNQDVFLICDNYTFRYLKKSRRDFFNARESVKINSFQLKHNKIRLNIQKFYAPDYR
jgi:hypothetical protein